MSGQRNQLRFDPHGVAVLVLRSLQETLDVITISVGAIRSADLTQPLPEFGNGVVLRFTGDLRTPDERRIAYSNWLYVKGLQEFARAVRHALEEAYVYTKIIAFALDGNRTTTWGKLKPLLDECRGKAEKMKFPKLMSEVNKGLSTALHFEKEFLSLQKVRNCLEHRGGLVGDADVDPVTGTLILSFPRLMICTEKSGIVEELSVGSSVEAGQQIGFRMVSENREFARGSRLAFSENDLMLIGWGCWAFASELQQKLPALPKGKYGSSGGC